YVIDHANKLHERGQINFTGTFYSEPVNVSINGESNLRCAILGTSIIANEVGPTDGFYLQERAYHPQLPWILNEADVTWVPVITGDETYFPFKLNGLEGSSIVCIPNIDRQEFPSLLLDVPDGCLLTIEGDYEMPRSFGSVYNKVNKFLEDRDDIEVEWITVKEYIEKFGVNLEKYIDHTAVSRNINNGTYSRWTADPLDIIVQEKTNAAQNDFRAANMMHSLIKYYYNENLDEPLKDSKIELIHDPLVWDIASTENYPDVEEMYLNKDGVVTTLSKMEHLLVWAVNSDSRGWYPLYEKRRERINSLENCSVLSNSIVNKGMDFITENIVNEGYDKNYILFNARPAQEKIVQLETIYPYEVFDARGVKLRSSIISNGDSYIIDVKVELPAFGYTTLGLKKTSRIDHIKWEEGNTISNGSISISANGDKITYTCEGKNIEMTLDDFMLKPLTEMVLGVGDENWRKAKPFGAERVMIYNGLYPQLRLEKQIDWLVHMQQIFTLLPDRILCSVNFTFPHPTVLRENGKPEKEQSNHFQPGGLNLRFNSFEPGKVFYTIPFGTTPHSLEEQSYFCSLHTGIFQFKDGGGFMITNGTGEQAFFTNPAEGQIGVYLGASVCSGPIRNVEMDIVNNILVNHEPAWYAEPFHGTYNHNFMLFPYEGSWEENHAAKVAIAY
ncbi:MAG: hypothetical protein PF689_05205, partial [Deltaproteobacteria bacterium]|nr:hypothetical protein [Deltaproteobacteria bacterium]